MKSVKIVFVLLVLAVQFAKAQDTTVVISANRFDKFTDQLSLANNDGWIFRQGNDSTWARANIDIAGWIKMKEADLSKKHADKNGRVEGWFRIKLKFDSSLSGKKLWIDFPSWAAIDFYIDGRLMATRGNIGDNGKPFSEYNGDTDPLAITFATDTVHTFAIHFAGYLSPFPPHDLKYKSSSNDLLTIVGPNPYVNFVKLITVEYSFLNIWLAVCAVLTLLFWLLAFQNRREKNLVWIAVCTSIYSLLNFAEVKGSTIGLHYVTYSTYNEISIICIELLLFIIIPLLLARIFKRKPNIKLLIFLVALFVLSFLTSFFNISRKILDIMDIVTFLSTLGVSLYYIFSSWKKLYGAQWAIVIGLFFSLFSICVGVAYSAIIESSLNIYLTFTILSCFILSFPISLLVYVSMRFREIIRDVRVNADRVVQLSEEKRLQAESQQQMLQEEVNRQTAEIRHTLDNLRSTQAQLVQSEKMASLGELTEGIAHEIQNPLNFVNNFSEVNNELIEEMNNENDINEVKAIGNDIRQNNEKILFHGKRADAIVKGMLQHSGVSSGQKEPTDINALCDEYLRLSYHGLRAKDKDFNATIKTDFDGSIGKINIIPQDIGRVLLNLFNNAFYAVNQQKTKNLNLYEPTVTVSTSLNPPLEGREASVIITVRDNGGGIPDSIKEKIFQPFFTTKPTGSGTGLGLSLSYDIIKAHGGEIKVESKEASPEGPVGQGEGTTFIIQLPINF
ncbi:MAG: sensor histidine kinase [Ginsengibacter sp.]